MLAWDVSVQLAGNHVALEGVARATTQANTHWKKLLRDELSHSLPVSGRTMGAFLDNGSIVDSGSSSLLHRRRAVELVVRGARLADGRVDDLGRCEAVNGDAGRAASGA